MNGPYRAPRPLTEAIEPDRRTAHALVFGVVCMAFGALVCKGVGALVQQDPPPPSMAGFGTSPPDLSTPPSTAFLSRAALAPPPAAPSFLTNEDITNMVSAQRETLKTRCWRRSERATKSTAFTLSLVVAPNGNVISSTGNGADGEVADCAATQAMAWHFPVRAGGDAYLAVPFRFRASEPPAE